MLALMALTDDSWKLCSPIFRGLFNPRHLLIVVSRLSISCFNCAAGYVITNYIQLELPFQNSNCTYDLERKTGNVQPNNDI